MTHSSYSTTRDRLLSRGDTLHLCQGFIDAGWACWPMFYSDAVASHLQTKLQSYDAVLPRINPGR